jgi:DNA polymerase-3 subunit alpha
MFAMASDRSPKDPILRAATGAKPALRATLPFIHLRVHSAYSLLEGALQISKVVSHAVTSRSPAIAVTDTNNLFGALEFANKASKEGIQPLIGCQIDICFEDTTAEAAARTHRQTGPECQPLTLIAATEIGYANLVRIVSDAYLTTEAGLPPHRPVSALQGLCDGVICLSGGPRGPIGSAFGDDHSELAESRLFTLKELFGDRLYVELERVGDYDRAIEQKTIQLAYRHELPLVAI